MRLALLNLPYDNNYGGNLQRYALMKVLEDMGHDVTHLNLHFSWFLPWYRKPWTYLKRFVKRNVMHRDIRYDAEKLAQLQYDQLNGITEPFYEKYIKHTEVITNRKQLAKYNDFDGYVVGSDQVWRKMIAGKYMAFFFFDYLTESDKLRIAYAVSLGSSASELDESEIAYYGSLYQKFSAVSVREESGLKLLRQYGWNIPKPQIALDPTLLLSQSDYLSLIDKTFTQPMKQQLLCYILDSSELTGAIVQNVVEKTGYDKYDLGIDSGSKKSVEQWLRCFYDCKFVVTDSYHGVLFSIIFNKPFIAIGNKKRGIARMEDILNLIKLNYRLTYSADDVNMIMAEVINWTFVASLLDNYRQQSIDFLIKSLMIE